MTYFDGIPHGHHLRAQLLHPRPSRVIGLHGDAPEIKKLISAAKAANPRLTIVPRTVYHATSSSELWLRCGGAAMVVVGPRPSKYLDLYQIPETQHSESQILAELRE